MSDSTAALAQAIREWGQAMRGDWSDVDGRSVRNVCDDWAAELEGNRKPMTLEDHRIDLGICRAGGGHWDDYCGDYDCEAGR